MKAEDWIKVEDRMPDDGQDCVYVQALNEKNARKKLIKMGYRL